MQQHLSVYTQCVHIYTNQTNGNGSYSKLSMVSVRQTAAQGTYNMTSTTPMWLQVKLHGSTKIRWLSKLTLHWFWQVYSICAFNL